MSVLAVGLSHASAPVTTLERAVVSGDAQVKLLQDVFAAENVAGSLVLSTCNRIEVYAEVDRFHGGDAAGQNLVSLGLELAARARDSEALQGLSVLVIGAGSMSSLAVATAVRQKAGQVVVANRTPARAQRLAGKYGASATGLDDLPLSMAGADIVVACTGAAEQIVTQAPGGRGAAPSAPPP